jgi:RNA polymerase sigma-70 factor (ECF subfamily)
MPASAFGPLTRSGSGPSDAALVVAARAGEPWAREALFRRYARMALGLAFRLLGRDDEIEDLVQDCFVQALSSLDRIDDPQAFAAWFTAVVVRTTHKLLRRRSLAARLGLRRGREEPVDVDALIAPTAPPDVQMELRAVYRIINDLPAPQRIALVLRRIEGASQEEVAQYLDVSVSTAKRLLAAAERKLEVELGDAPEPRRRR